MKKKFISRLHKYIQFEDEFDLISGTIAFILVILMGILGLMGYL